MAQYQNQEAWIWFIVLLKHNSVVSGNLNTQGIIRDLTPDLKIEHLALIFQQYLTFH